MLSLVGGKVESDGQSADILERTIKREILEEIGVKIKDRLHYVHSSIFVSDVGDSVLNIVFLCEYHSGSASPLSQDEVEEVFWLTTAEILNHPMAPIYLKESINLAEKVIPNGY